jgi:putative acyl-CoA dehydrogenase
MCRRSPASGCRRLLSRDYDKRFIPAAQKNGVLIGMGLTEKQGGSDVRANTTRAEPMPDGSWRLTGHKWFLSAPMCDAFLVTAQSPKGPVLLLRAALDAGWAAQRAAHPALQGKDGRPLECRHRDGVLGLAGLAGGRGRARHPHRAGDGRLYAARLRDRQHRHHARCAVAGPAPRRLAFRLRQAAERPAADANVLADMALETEAATALSMRLARAFDAQEDEAESLLRRILTPVAKYWICKRCPTLVAEAMEVHGGNGYVDEGPMPRLFKQSPLNSIWEGSGNVMCLDTLRAMAATRRASKC